MTTDRPQPTPMPQLYVLVRDAAGQERTLAGPFKTHQALQRALAQAWADGREDAFEHAVFNGLREG